jgi:energy-coupling factor transporter ATP-binding protein EcfA2
MSIPKIDYKKLGTEIALNLMAFKDDDDDDDSDYNDDNESDSDKHTLKKRKLKQEPISKVKIKKQRVTRVLDLPFVVKNWADFVKLVEMAVKLPKSHIYRDCGNFRDMYDTVKKLDNMVGMKNIKESMVDHIIDLTQKNDSKKDSKVLEHVIITGPPGHGKTTVAHILTELFFHMGKLKENKVIIGNNTNMIGKYLWFSSRMTRAKVEEALGGCLLIDEAYQIGANDNINSAHAQECVDTLNACLSEYAGKFLCILVGYKNTLDHTLFSLNHGLRRRFTWTYEVKPLEDTELCELFYKTLGDTGKETKQVTIVTPQWFHKNKSHFKFAGGSIITFIDKIKKAHSRRVHGIAEKNNITDDDIVNGFNMYKKYETSTYINEKDTSKPPPELYG